MFGSSGWSNEGLTMLGSGRRSNEGRKRSRQQAEAGNVQDCNRTAGKVQDCNRTARWFIDLGVSPKLPNQNVISSVCGISAGAAPANPTAAAAERPNQWGTVETKQLISLRAQLEEKFSASRWNRVLWELVAGGMRQLGFRRTSEQCRSKWKRLIGQYKGLLTSFNPEFFNIVPFYDELHAFFAANPLNREIQNPHRTIPEMLRDFLQQRLRIEMQCRNSMEKLAEKREAFEDDQRRSTELLKMERMMMEQAWRERQEQRMAREERRAENRDALLNALLNKLIQDKDT